MNLDDMNLLELDKEKSIDLTNKLPDQIRSAWELGKELPISNNGIRLERILIIGMGNSIISGELIATYCSQYGCYFFEIGI